MATLLYFRNTIFNKIGTIASPPLDIIYDMTTTVGTLADTAIVTLTAGGTEIPWTKTEGVSKIGWITPRVPVGGFTLAAEPTVTFFAEESNQNDNAGVGFKLYKYSGGVATQIEAIAENGTELLTSPGQRDITLGTVDPDISFAENDRLLIVPFAIDVGTMTAGTATMYWNTGAGSYPAGISLVETVAFKSDILRMNVMVGGVWKETPWENMNILIRGGDPGWKKIQSMKIKVAGQWKNV